MGKDGRGGNGNWVKPARAVTRRLKKEGREVRVGKRELGTGVGRMWKPRLHYGKNYAASGEEEVRTGKSK